MNHRMKSSLFLLCHLLASSSAYCMKRKKSEETSQIDKPAPVMFVEYIPLLESELADMRQQVAVALIEKNKILLGNHPHKALLIQAQNQTIQDYEGLIVSLQEELAKIRSIM